MLSSAVGTPNTVPVFGATANVFAQSGITFGGANKDTVTGVLNLTASGTIYTPTLNVNTINEKDSNNGVIIDGIRIRDEQIVIPATSDVAGTNTTGPILWVKTTSAGALKFTTGTFGAYDNRSVMTCTDTTTATRIPYFTDAYGGNGVSHLTVTYGSTEDALSGISTLTMSGLLSTPKGIKLDGTYSTPPTGYDAFTLWVNHKVSAPAADILTLGASTPILQGTYPSVASTIPKWTDTNGYKLTAGAVVLDDSANMIQMRNGGSFLNMDPFYNSGDSGSNVIMGFWDPDNVPLPAYNTWYTGYENTIIGVTNYKFDAVTCTGYDNTVVGNYNLPSIEAGSYNHVFGSGCGRYLTNGNENVLIGRRCGDGLTTGVSNIAIGENAGSVVTTGVYNIFMGYGTFPSAANAIQQIAIGYGANTSSNYSCQIGQPGQISQSAIMKFRSQKVCDEAWRDTYSLLAFIDASGNIAKATYSNPVGGHRLSYDNTNGHLTVPGELTVDGLIDPTGLEFVPVAENPGHEQKFTMWIDSLNKNTTKMGVNTMVLGCNDLPEMNTVPRWSDEFGGMLKKTPLIINDDGSLSSLSGTVAMKSRDVSITLDSETGKFSILAPNGETIFSINAQGQMYNARVAGIKQTMTLEAMGAGEQTHQIQIKYRKVDDLVVLQFAKFVADTVYTNMSGTTSLPDELLPDTEDHIAFRFSSSQKLVLYKSGKWEIKSTKQSSGFNNFAVSYIAQQC
jgi:hypothetical protein